MFGWLVGFKERQIVNWSFFAMPLEINVHSNFIFTYL